MQCFYLKQTTTWSGFSASCYVNINGSQFSIEYIRDFFFPSIEVEGMTYRYHSIFCGICGMFTFISCLFQTSNHKIWDYIQLLHSGQSKLDIEICIWDRLKWAGDVQGRICKWLQAALQIFWRKSTLKSHIKWYRPKILPVCFSEMLLFRFHTACHAVANNSVVVLSLGALSSRPQVCW